MWVFIKTCGTPIRTLADMLERIHYLNSVRLWQYQLSFVNLSAGH
jgi:hypothetical protein